MKEIIHIAEVVVGALTALGVVIEVAPIKISPLKWIGDRLNKSTHDKFDAINKRVDAIEYRSAMKDLADVRNRVLSYGMLIRKGEQLDHGTLQSVQHDLDTYDYYKETYQYMDVNGRKLKINGEIEVARDLIQEQMRGE